MTPEDQEAERAADRHDALAYFGWFWVHSHGLWAFEPDAALDYDERMN